ncbi:ECF transporter S component [Clostridium sp. MB40-C1]|uniref:ECF transporter S component n=1 Tax=Clostridium sp. MB40-C1 TaxID=3070996 RepID=UPI0027E17212|nr:ECF transporter S component [Clostridium sp. MB40-C1]WMJ79202.1 ECF transporter S component [Clostridium sp. MB40-C1]
MREDVKKLTFTALLTAFAIIIPLYFGFLRIVIPPVFSATIASHVPVFLAMFLGPGAAIAVGVGSAFGFLIALGPYVAARAFMHVFVGIIGAYLLKKNISFTKIVIITAPIHGLLEGISTIPFMGVKGFTVSYVILTVGVGTVIHHIADGLISGVLVQALEKSGQATFVKKSYLQK